MKRPELQWWALSTWEKGLSSLIDSRAYKFKICQFVSENTTKKIKEENEPKKRENIRANSLNINGGSYN